MEFGLSLCNQFDPGDDLTARVAQHAEQVRLAREAGFTGVLTGQHILGAPFAVLQTIPLLARMSAESGGMLVVPGVLLLPLLNPVMVAEEVATLDIMTGGRVALGVAQGYRDLEFAACGAAKKERLPRFLESLEIIKKLWTEEGEVEFRGRFYTLPRVRPTLRPVQKPRPPIWIGATGDRSIRRAAELGEGWIVSQRTTIDTIRKYLPVYRGAAGADAPLIVRRELLLGESRAEALRRAGPLLERKYREVIAWGHNEDLPEADRISASLEESLAGRFIVGSTEDCLEELSRYASLGVSRVFLRLQWPGMPQEEVLRTIEALGKKVLPASAP